MGVRVFPRGYVPKRGEKFGSLSATGKNRLQPHDGQKARFSEVLCAHGSKRNVLTCALKRGEFSSCRTWSECLPKCDDTFGELTATGRNELRRHNGGRQRFSEVPCSHGVVKFVSTRSLKKGRITTCRRWAANCLLPERNIRFGELTTTGKHKLRKNNQWLSEVRCPHGSVKFVLLNNLKRKLSTTCVKWIECEPQNGDKFGQLLVTGKRETRRTYGFNRGFSEVQCPHGRKKFICTALLKRGRSTSCKQWQECVLTKHQHSHRRYIREHTPKLDITTLSEQQNKVCVVCGNMRSKGVLNSIEHLIPIVAFVRAKWSLKEKNARANSVTNLFASHRGCNNSKNGHSIIAWWKNHPGCEAPARAAIERARQARQVA